MMEFEDPQSARRGFGFLGRKLRLNKKEEQRL
jgi:hypothetical protein